MVSRVLLQLYAFTTTLKQCATLRKPIHFNDKNKNNPHNIPDKLFKVQPLLALAGNNCLNVESEQFHYIDEQISSVKIKPNKHITQYNPKKIHKWGLRIWSNRVELVWFSISLNMVGNTVLRQKNVMQRISWRISMTSELVSLFWQLVFNIISDSSTPFSGSLRPQQTLKHIDKLHVC